MSAVWPNTLFLMPKAVSIHFDQVRRKCAKYMLGNGNIAMLGSMYSELGSNIRCATNPSQMVVVPNARSDCHDISGVNANSVA
jgi:hypothetical protein